jgi:hypothetical protein
MSNERGNNKDRLASRLARGLQPGRARVQGKRFTENNQPKGRGRPKGAVNVITREVKEAILAACNRHGEDGRGTNGLEGYMYKLAREEPRTMAMLLRAIMPTQVTVEPKEAPRDPDLPYETVDELRRDLADKHILHLFDHLLSQGDPPLLIEAGQDERNDDDDDGGGGGGGGRSDSEPG